MAGYSFGQIRSDQKLAERQGVERRRTLPILRRCCECSMITHRAYVTVYAGKRKTRRLCLECAGITAEAEKVC